MKKFYLLTILITGLFIETNAQSATDGTATAITQMGESQIAGIQENWGHLASINSHIGEALGHFGRVADLYNNAHDMYDASLQLDPSACVPDLNVDAAHMMPTVCRDNGECQSCYSGAYRELAFIRRQLARLSCIYNNTKRFNQSALAFGDNASGIHAVTGLSWQYARADIVSAYESFKHTYDTKYEGMMGTLQRALMDIARCEGQYGGSPDWYARFGFIYFEMMKEKYKRTD